MILFSFSFFHWSKPDFFFFFSSGLLMSAVSNNDLGLTSSLWVARVRAGTDLKSGSWVPDYWPGACMCMWRQMLAKFSVQTDLMTPIVMVLSISRNDDRIGRSGAWWFWRRWRRVRNFLKLWEAREGARGCGLWSGKLGFSELETRDWFV